MVATETKNQVKTTRIRWTEDERTTIYTHMFERGVSIHVKGVDLIYEIKKSVVETGTRKRKLTSDYSWNERRALDTWLKDRKIRGLSIPKKPEPAVVKPKQEIELPKDLASSPEDIVEKVRIMLDEHFQSIQSLVIGSHDSLMHYWDPMYASALFVQPEFISTQPGAKKISTPRKRKVLVVSNNARQILSLQESFNGLDFTFIDGGNPRQLKAGGHYDLVICTKFIAHQTSATLKAVHGSKVLVVDGSKNQIIDVIRDKFAI